MAKYLNEIPKDRTRKFNKKIKKVEKALEKVLTALYGDESWREDENLIDTPNRIARMYVTEIFSSITGFKEKPQVTFFEKSASDNMVTLFNIELKSTCSHHFVPFVGKAHIAYIPKNGKVCGISKLVRIVDYHMTKPQIQERLTDEIIDDIMEMLDPQGAMVVLEARHYCMIQRGVKQFQSVMVTSAVRGLFETNVDGCKDEFMSLLEMNKAKF